MTEQAVNPSLIDQITLADHGKRIGALEGVNGLCIKFVAIVAALRFLGIQNLAELLKLFGVHPA